MDKEFHNLKQALEFMPIRHKLKFLEKTIFSKKYSLKKEYDILGVFDTPKKFLDYLNNTK